MSEESEIGRVAPKQEIIERQRTEIAELRKSCEHHAEEWRDAVNGALNVEHENRELSVYIERLRDSIQNGSENDRYLILKETPKQSLSMIRKDAFIKFACYLLDNHESYFPQGEEEIQRICARAVEADDS